MQRIMTTFVLLGLAMALVVGTAVGASVGVPRVQGIKVDGNLSDWEGISETFVSSKMLKDALDITDDADCSAHFRFGYDADYVYMAARISDDVFFWNTAQDRNAYKFDAVEVWMNGAQLFFTIGAGQPYAFERRPVLGLIEGAETSIVTHETGWIVESKIPVAHIERYISAKPAQGVKFQLAFGVDDADVSSGTRDGQIYWPESYQHSNPDTFAAATFQ